MMRKLNDPFKKSAVVVNLGGEGEVAGVINQQGPWAIEPNWASATTGQSLLQLQAVGHQLVISSNTELPLATGSVDQVLTNSVPIDTDTWLGPGIQSREIWRILAPNRVWINNGIIISRYE